MKKIISLILCIALVSLVLVSCGDEEHVHQYNRDDWASDKDGHWYANTCGCEDAGVKNFAEHDYSMNNGYCAVCGYKNCDKTDYKYDFNENSHWLTPSCGHTGSNSHLPIKDVEVHSFNESGKCTECGYQRVN